MTKRMLIDATHAEETRVVVLDDTKLEDFDVETASKRQLKGNIYLAKIVRVEPSLQAAFVEYGGGRHGFLAFGEIHPDYYQIPIADRQRLLAIQAEDARAAEAAEEAELDQAEPKASPPLAEPPAVGLEASVETEAESGAAEAEPPEPPVGAAAPDQTEPSAPDPEIPATVAVEPPAAAERASRIPAQPMPIEHDTLFAPFGTAPEPDVPGEDVAAAEPVTETGEEPPEIAFRDAGAAEPPDSVPDSVPDTIEVTVTEDLPPPETLGGDDSTSEAAEDARARRTSRLLRSYRIQEVIHRRQIILVQVVKEERGTKGAALTTYISLAGRFSVLMPNSQGGGGISRKITSAADRKRLKEVTAELDLPPGMGLIVRTAGANRPKPEIRRDCEYLMRLWDDIREHTLRSVAPALIYEEASLIKRAIRDVYSRDIDDILVDGDEGFRAAHDFMRMLMPAHARKVQLWRGGDGNGQAGQPLFARYQVEQQLEAMLSPTVQLRSGGYLVIDQTEALVAIDVNSGRSTRERNVEETALRTNLEAADEVARQVRLRDLAGLIVVDFIDMESRRHNAAVEKRLKDALRVDRARIQLGQISHFGLLEMSRQRLRPSLAETSFEPCPHCGGTGQVRNVESSAISVLRAIEDEGAKARASLVMVHTATAAMMYLLNHKRERLGEIEARFAMRVQFAPDETVLPGQARIERLRAAGELPPPRVAGQGPVVPVAPALPAPEFADDADTDDEEPETEAVESGVADGRAASTAEENERRRKRRRRRRGGRRENGGAETAADAADGDAATAPEPEPDGEAGSPDAWVPEPAGLEMAPATEVSPPELEEQPELDATALDEDGLPKARRRGRRGGRRRRREGEDAEVPAPVEASPPPLPYRGPTPADPFGSGVFDIFDMIDTAAEPPRLQVTAPGIGPERVEPEWPQPDAPAPDATIDEAEVPPVVAPEPEEPEPTPTAVEPVSAEPHSGPRIQPVVIGDGAPAAEPRRGWWRR